MEVNPQFSRRFNRYTKFDPLVPVYEITNGQEAIIPRFYDTSPISPSGRYIALSQFPFEDRLPTHRDVAYVFVLDLQTGEEVFREATAAWDTQLGAHAQWGASDEALYFNSRGDDGMPHSRCANIFSGEVRSMQTPVYMISPDGKSNATPSLAKLCLVQPGYGLIMEDVEAFRNCGAPEDDGLFVSDTQTGEPRLLVSLATIWRAFPDKFRYLDPNAGGLYGFHAKWSPDGQKLMFIVRWLAAANVGRRTKNFLITCSADGTDLHMPVDDARWQGGHHPNWCPDSETIIMNLRFSKAPKVIIKASLLAEKVLRRFNLKLPIQLNPIRFALIHHDGSKVCPIPGGQLGSGHPTLSPDGRFVLSDAYPYEDITPGDGTVPLRFISVADGSMRQAVRIHCRPAFNGPNAEYRVDPHPAWHGGGRLVTFNACPNGKRAVYIADFSSLMKD